MELDPHAGNPDHINQIDPIFPLILTSIPNEWCLSCFAENIRFVGTCWLWKGKIKAGRYGVFQSKYKKIRSVHRLAYQWAKGAIPDGFTIDHLCRNPKCINPLHLDCVSFEENQRRARIPFSRNGIVI